MKFFTIQWWCGIQQGVDHDPVPAFQQHLATIRDRLPPDLLALQETVSLHDARLRKISYPATDQTLTMQLDGCNDTGGLRKFTLRYQEVQSFTTTANPKLGLPGPHGFGDLGYDEPDITSDGHFEHRLLFSSGIEMQIVFRDFELKY